MNRAHLRRIVLALAVVTLAVIAGCAALDTSSADVTVENAEPTTYQLHVYVFEEPVGAGNLTYRVTNDTGARTTVEHVQLDTEGPYYNLSLGAKWNATVRRVAVPANETTTASFTVWDSGETVVYVFERPDGRVVRTSYAECTADTLSHTFVFSDGPANGYTMSCGSTDSSELAFRLPRSSVDATPRVP